MPKMHALKGYYYKNQCQSFNKFILIYFYPLSPLCVACKYKRIFGVLEVLKTQKIDPDILACKCVRIYLHAIIRHAITRFSKC